MNQKKAFPTSPKSHLAGSAEPYEKCERTNHTTPKCRVGTNRSMWCGRLKHLIAACPQRLKVIDKGAAKPLALPHQGAPPPRPAAVGRACVMRRRKLPALVQ